MIQDTLQALRWTGFYHGKHIPLPGSCDNYGYRRVSWERALMIIMLHHFYHLSVRYLPELRFLLWTLIYTNVQHTNKPRPFMIREIRGWVIVWPMRFACTAAIIRAGYTRIWIYLHRFFSTILTRPAQKARYRRIKAVRPPVAKKAYNDEKSGMNTPGSRARYAYNTGCMVIRIRPLMAK